MKLLSALTAAIMAAAVFLPAIDAKAETSQSVTVPGDIDLNNRFTLSDVVAMKNYLLGSSSLSEQAFLNADLNSDGSADVLDMCLFRKKLIAECGGFSGTVSDLQITDDIQTDCHENVIFSQHDLYNYFSPLSVIPIEGECFEVPTTTDEDIEKFAGIYDEEFFRHNILLLKTEYKPDGGENHIGDIYYSGNTIKAEYYQTYSGEKTNRNREEFQLLQVVIPRDLNVAKGFDWKYRYPDAEAKVTSEFTRELTNDGWKTAVYGNKPVYLTSKKSLDKWAYGKFHSAVEKALEKRYTEKFFAEYDLVIDLYAQKNDTWLVSPKADVTSESVTLTYDREFIRGFAPEGVYITQAVVPKGACRNRGTASKRSWEYQKNLTYKEYDIGMLSASNNTDMLMTNKMDPQWVNSQAELDEYLGKCLTDEAIELIGAKLIWGSAYVWLDSGLTGTTHTLASSYISDDDKKITVNMLSSSPYGDMGGSFLHILSTDPSKSGYEVKKHDFNTDENFPTFDEDPVEIDFGDTSRYDFRTLFADQYSFGDEHSADLYITHSGGGPQRYRSYEYLGTIELSEEYEPFTDKYTTVENDDGSYTVTGEVFIITYNDGILSVSCRTSTDSEYKVLEFDIGN